MLKPLTWINDPLLFEAEPLHVNQWLNANELIQQNRSKEIFLDGDQQLNLYPIMVRKNDFVRKNSNDRIMARFPFLVISSDIQEQIKNKILLISEITRDYFYKSINKSIMKWKEDILKYLTRGAIPYPIMRCCFELVPNLHALVNETSLRFTSARGEAFEMPTILTKELAYLAGMVNGDGNLQKYTLRIVDYSITNIKQLHRMFEDYFAQTGNILYKTENCPEVVITNLWIVRLFSFLTSQPIGGKKYHALREPLIFQQDSTFRSYYWSGVMDADGSYKNKNVTFISASTRYVKDFKKFLSESGINSKLTEREDCANVYIPSSYHTQLARVLVCLHPEKKLEFNALESTPSRIPVYFIGFKDSSQLKNYFNFKLIKSLSIAGLGKTIRHFRGKQSRRIFVESLNISERSLQDIENEVMSINVLLLDEILKQNQKQLMPFLTQQTSIRYHIRSSVHIRLDTHPNEQLASLLKPLLFYKQRINIPITKSNLKQKIENHFQISLGNNRITNRLLLQYFSIFCVIKHSENF